MTRSQIVDKVKLLLQANSAQLNTDLASTAYIGFVQSAYRQLWTRISYEANSNGNSTYLDFTWPAGEPTKTVTSAGLTGQYLLGFYYVLSNDATGRRITTVRYQDPTTLVWDSPPQTDTTVRAYFRLCAESLGSDSSVPALIGPEHHDAIAYEAAIQICEAQNRNVPGTWVQRLENLEYYAFKSITNKIFRNESRIVPNDLEAIVFQPQ